MSVSSAAAVAARYDVEVHLHARPGGLARFAECLGAAGVNLEGGGVFTHAGTGIAHFLVDDGAAAGAALRAACHDVVAIREVLSTSLDQETPGQLASLCRRLADDGLDILVQYSDHDGRLVLVVADGHRRAATRALSQWEDRRTRQG